MSVRNRTVIPKIGGYAAKNVTPFAFSDAQSDN
jgi:hypothetical protein